MSEAQSRLQCRSISVSFGGMAALRDVDLDVAPGEVHGLVGCNGAGKSTLMKVLAGAIPAYSGHVALDGRALRLDSPRTALAHGVAMVYQELSGVGQLSVAENLCLGRQPRTRWGTIDWQRMRREAASALEELGVSLPVSQALREFPLAIRQLVEIARGLHSGARVLILDEPTSALSLPEAQRLFAVLRTLKSRGVSLIFISHFLEDVLAICDRVTILRDGQLVTTQPAAALTRESIMTQMVGSSSDAPGQTTSETRLVLNTKPAVRLRIDGFTRGRLFQDVSLKVRAGECLGLYGYVGAGHQELLHAIAGAEPVERGELRVDNRVATIRRVSDAVRAGVVLVAADRGQTIVRRAPVAHNATLAHLTTAVGRWITRRAERRVCVPLLERVGCRPPDPGKLAGQLSGGNQQKVVFGRWLLGPIHVLLLEEPTRGMDVHAKTEIMQLVAEQKAQGVAVILASTEPELLLSYADRILTFCRGRQTREFAEGPVTKSDLMLAAEREPEDYA